MIYHISDKSSGGLSMDTREAIANRIRELCKEHGITPNGLANISAVSQATIKSILNGESKNPGTITTEKKRIDNHHKAPVCRPQTACVPRNAETRGNTRPKKKTARLGRFEGKVGTAK